MLISLHVKNLALIDEEEIFFENGLNILTGETGAGKSVVIGSVNLALGAKADKELIRNGAEYALVELTFQLNEYQRDALKQMDIFPEADGQLVIQRKIMQSRNVCKVCGESTGTKQLQEMAAILIDIHGQHENQSLLQKKRQKEILDKYAKEALGGLFGKMKECYAEYKQILKELEENSPDEGARGREASLLRFEIEEIEKADPILREDEELEQSYRRMVNSRKIEEAVNNAYRMTGNDAPESAAENVGRALREMRSVSSYDEQLSELLGQLLEIDSLLNDFNRAAADYMSALEFDGEDFQRIENRLNLLNHLKDKYGKDLEEVLAYKTKCEERLRILDNYEEHLQILHDKRDDSIEKLNKLCRKVSGIRTKAASELSVRLKQALCELNFENVEFEIQVRPDHEAMSADGYDDVECMISTNKGEKLKPLSHVASGGELSRIMLALKTVLADKDDIQTLIFDEIDTGISGKTAWKVSEKLGLLSKDHQIICITHLPQIAAMADHHFLIEKGYRNDRTITTIQITDEKGSLAELARMLGGEKITEAVMENAKEMKELARNTKQN